MYRTHPTAKVRTVLVAAAFLCFSRGLIYSGVLGPPQAPKELIFASGDGFMLPVFSIAWVLGGLYCLYSIRRGLLLRPMAIVAGLLTAWAAAWIIGGTFAPGAANWQTGVFFLAAAVVVATLTTLTPRHIRDDK